MGKKITKNENIGRKIIVGKRVMHALRKSENGMTVAQLKMILHKQENALKPSVSDIRLALKNGLQRGALSKRGMLYKAADTVKSCEEPMKIINSTDGNKQCECIMCQSNSQKCEEDPILKMEKAPSLIQCATCLDKKKRKTFVRLCCNHILCRPCIGMWLKMTPAPLCPICFQKMVYGEILS